MVYRLSDRLTSIVTGMGRCGVLFSGGADSESLLRAAVHLLGTDNVLSLSAITPLLASHHRDHIAKVVKELEVDCVMLPVDLLADRRFTENGRDRCYICKRRILEGLSASAAQNGFQVIVDGTVPEDLFRDRPGLAASAEMGVRHPFVEADTGEEEVGHIGLLLGADPAGRPSDSCLATRISSELEITLRAVSLVEAVEAPIRPCARGRVRAVLGPDGMDLHYTELDRDLIHQRARELTETASRLGVKLRLVLG